MSEVSGPFEKTEKVEHDPEKEIIRFCKDFKKKNTTALNNWLTNAGEDDYQTHRRAVKKALGWDLKAVDRKRRKLNGKSKADAKGTRLEWLNPEPWETAVDGAELLTSIQKILRQHVTLKPELEEAVTAWAVMTWLHDALEVAPFLNVTSPDMRCGKSTLLDVLSQLVRRPLANAGSITGPALFRTIEEYAPTMLLDEIDTYLKDNPDLMGTINGSQRKTQAFQIRCVGEDHEPRRFATWCPKVLTGIRKIPDTVLDRSIIIRMERRSKNDPPIIQFRRRDKRAFSDIQRKIVRWIDDNEAVIMTGLGKVNFPEGLDDRAADCWECLLAITETAGGEWPRKLYAACEKASQAKDEGTIREILLADIKTIYEKKGNPAHLPTSLLLQKLENLDSQTWAEFSRGKPITAAGLGKLLKPYGISSGTIRTGGETYKGYKREAFTSAWGRYLNVTTSQSPSSLAYSEKQSVTNDIDVTAKKAPKAASSLGCDVVTDKIPPDSEESEKYEVLI